MVLLEFASVFLELLTGASSILLTRNARVQKVFLEFASVFLELLTGAS